MRAFGVETRVKIVGFDSRIIIKCSCDVYDGNEWTGG
jgi:hypothetical protein